jgi:endonuclease/exonuclease/phosphatase family metal-dependent hydrolase
MSYNVPNNFDQSRNRLFNADRHPSYRRILQAVGPDVLAFQEIYDNTADEVEQEVEGPIDGISESWNWAKTGGELVLGSAYAIRDTATIRGAEGQPSGGYLLDTRDALGTRLVVVVMHPKCCGGASEDRSRQATVDGVVAFLRDLKQGEGPFTVPDETPIVVMGDMNFVGDAQQPRTLRTGQIVNTDEFGSPPAAPDWDGSPLLDTNPQQAGSPLHTTTFSTGSSFPPGRLDYAYVTDSVLDVVHEFLLSTPALSTNQRTEYGLDADDTTTGSDHLPVVIDVAK